VQGVVIFATKLVAMATSIKISEKGRSYRSSAIQYLPYGAKIVKIGPALLIVRKKKKKEKLTQAKYIALPASLRSGLNYAK